MPGVIPLTDATRRPVQLPVATLGLIAANVLVFFLELQGAEPFVLRWACVPSKVLGRRSKMPWGHFGS